MRALCTFAGVRATLPLDTGCSSPRHAVRPRLCGGRVHPALLPSSSAHLLALVLIHSSSIRHPFHSSRVRHPFMESRAERACGACDGTPHSCRFLFEAGSVSRKEAEQPLNLTDCAERGFRYEPPDMFLSFRCQISGSFSALGVPLQVRAQFESPCARTTEPNYEACRERCKLTVYCRLESRSCNIHHVPPRTPQKQAPFCSFKATSLHTGPTVAAMLLVAMLIGCHRKTTRPSQDRLLCSCRFALGAPNISGSCRADPVLLRPNGLLQSLRDDNKPGRLGDHHDIGSSASRWVLPKCHCGFLRCRRGLYAGFGAVLSVL